MRFRWIREAIRQYLDDLLSNTLAITPAFNEAGSASHNEGFTRELDGG